MNETKMRERDAFTFSLGGLRTIASFAPAPAIARDRINRAIDERLRQSHVDQPDTKREIPTFWGRFWLQRRRAA